MLRKYIGKEECEICIGKSNDWYLRAGEISTLIFFGEIEDGKETSKYCIDMNNKVFYFIQEQGKNVISSTSKPTNSEIKFQLVELVEQDNTIIFNMEGRGKITFTQIN